MPPVALFEIVLALLASALVLAGLASRTALPPAAALVVGGMVLALVPGVPAVTLDPDLTLVLFLPPLLMASAYGTAWRDFRAEMVPILAMAVGAVVFTTACVGFAVHWIAPALPLAACFTLGAIVSPPDAVAAKAVLQRLKLPRRLVTILEGESLVNDATGLVLYRFSVAAALTGTFDAGDAVGRFAWLAIGGLGIGLVAGFTIVQLLRRIQGGDLATALTLVASWITYIGAERLGASGVLAVVAAGIFVGMRQHATLHASVRVQAGAFWEVVVYVLEALVFVLIGLALRGVLDRQHGAGLVATLPITAAAVLVVVASRLIWVLLVAGWPALLPERWRSKIQSYNLWPALLVGWAGMRGVVTLAVALALPADFPGRDQLLVASFAVILFTVLIQGTTLGPLIRLARLEGLDEPGREPMNEAAARVAVIEAALAKLDGMHGPDGPLHPQLIEEYNRRLRATTRLRDDPETGMTRRLEHFTAALAVTTSGRAELIRLHRDGLIHDSVLKILEDEIDLEELRIRRLGRITEGLSR